MPVFDEQRPGVFGGARALQVEPDGQNSQVYPALARVPSALFGVCMVGTSGNVYAAVEPTLSFRS